MKTSLDTAARTYHQQINAEAVAYLRGRGIEKDTAEKFMLGYVAEPLPGDEPYTGRISIPSLGPHGVHAIKYRRIDGDHKPKYLTSMGTGARVFNTRALLEADRFIAATEGEVDCITLEMCGIPAVGLPGVEGWRKYHHRMFTGFSRVFIIGDNDDVGQGAKFAQKVASEVYGAAVVELPAGHDVNSVFVEGGVDAVRGLFPDDLFPVSV